MADTGNDTLACDGKNSVIRVSLPECPGENGPSVGRHTLWRQRAASDDVAILPRVW